MARKGGRARGASQPTKAMLLAAGQGTRLMPLTDQTPKCMVRVGGRPLLEYTITWLRRYGVQEVVINLHHLPAAVTGYFGDGSRWDLRITYTHEPEPLGTAGGVKNAADLFDGPFFVWYGDNLSTCRLDRLWEFHREQGGLATIALYEREDPSQSGILDLDEHHRITRFLEKPKREEVFSHWVSAGIFVLDPGVLDAIPSGRPADFGRDVFPTLLAQGRPLYGYRMAEDERLWWIDRPEDLAWVEGHWHTIGPRLREAGPVGQAGRRRPSSRGG